MRLTKAASALQASVLVSDRVLCFLLLHTLRFQRSYYLIPVRQGYTAEMNRKVFFCSMH